LKSKSIINSRKEFEMNSARTALAAMIAIVLASSSVALAIVPLEIGFQGRLVMSDGSTPPDGSYEVIFSMWDAPTGGNMLWTETQMVEVLSGQFNVALGSENDIPMEELSLNYEKIELEMQVLGDTPMMPRIPLNSVPYSLVASRVQGDVLTNPGTLLVGIRDSDFKWASLSGTASEAKLSLGQLDEEQLGLTADDQGSHYFMVDSFFDVAYRIEMSTSDLGGRLTVANIGSSGEDGVSVDVDPNSSRLIVSNIGSSGLDGVSVDVTEGNSFIGIEHEDIGDQQSSVLSMAGTSGGHLTVSNIGSSGDDGVEMHAEENYGNLLVSRSSSDGGTSSAEIKADDNGAGLLAIDSFFDVDYRIDYHAIDTEASSRISADDGLNAFSREDKATPNLYQATCDGAHENGHSFIVQAIDNQGSSGEYRWQPDVGDEVLVGFHAGDIGGRLTVANIGSSGEDGISMDVSNLASNLELENGGLELSSTVRLGVDENAATCGIEHEDIGGGGGYAVGSTASASGGELVVSNIGSSGDDGVSLLSDATHSMLSIKEGGNNTVQLSSDGTTDQLSLGDLNQDGRLDLVAGSSSSDVSVFFSDPFGKSGVMLGSAGGDGGGGRIALANQPAGETVPIEIVALSLVSAEPIIVVRNPDYSPTDPPVMEYEYDALNRLTQTIRDSETAPGESTKTSSNGFHVFDSDSEMHLDTRGLFFGDATGPTCAITPYGDVTLKRGVIMAQDLGTTVGIGSPSTGPKLWVDGDICATGSIGPCSDARYKKNVEDIESAVELISNLRGVRFDWRTDEFEDKHFSDRRQVGMIAQEVEKVVPEVVSKDDDGNYYMDYARLTPILIEAVKEQQKTIESLQERLEENENLRTEIDELRSMVLKLTSKETNSKTAVTLTEIFD
jgi:type VI protein secretion system component Hcp